MGNGANVPKTPPSHEIVCKRARGGKKPLWHAEHPDCDGIKYRRVVGAGNTADNAIADFQAQFRAMVRRGHWTGGGAPNLL